MGNALISQRSSRYTTIKFDNYETGATFSRGLATDFDDEISSIGATTVGNYALFGGGYVGTGSRLSTVYAYNSNLTRSKITSLSVARSGAGATTVGNYALFAGGYAGGTTPQTSTADTYTSGLVKGTATSLSVARYGLAATTIGNYALFGGGYNGSSYSPTVDAYNSSLTRSTPTALSVARDDLSATTAGSYALFGGGEGSSFSSTVDAYNSSLTRSTPTALSEAKQYLAATTIGNYALFGGGRLYSSSSGTSYSSVVDAYNSNLIRSKLTDLSYGRDTLSATTVGDYALFGGGATPTISDSDESRVDYYKIAFPNITLNVYKGAKYKFQNMSSETTYSGTMGTITVPTPATGYIKFKNTTIS